MISKGSSSTKLRLNKRHFLTFLIQKMTYRIFTITIFADQKTRVYGRKNRAMIFFSLRLLSLVHYHWWTIMFKQTNQIKKPDAYGTTFEIFSNTHISLKTTDVVTMQLRLPDRAIGLPFLMPTLETIKLSPFKLNSLKGGAKVMFWFFNKFFDTTFIFKKY